MESASALNWLMVEALAPKLKKPPSQSMPLFAIFPTMLRMNICKKSFAIVVMALFQFTTKPSVVIWNAPLMLSSMFVVACSKPLPKSVASE